jgi:hypothetical protein
MVEIGLMGSQDDINRAVLAENFELHFKRLWQSVLDTTDNDHLSFELSAASADSIAAEATADDTTTLPVVGQLYDEADDWLSTEGNDVDDGEATNQSTRVTSRVLSEATVHRITASVLSSYSFGMSVS